MTLEQLRAKQDELGGRINALSAKENRTAEETAELLAKLADAESVQTEIDIQARTAKVNAYSASPRPLTVKPEAPRAAASGMDKLDRFFATMAKGNRAVAAANDLFNEGTDADGKYLLPVDKKPLQSLIAPPQMVHSMCDIIFTNSNAVTVSVNEDPSWSDDLAAADVAEGDAFVEDKFGFGSVTLTLVKRGVLARVTREMVEDVPGIGQTMTSKITEKLAWKLHTLAVAAFLAASSKVAVAKTAGAAAGSAPDLANINKMYSSMLPQHRVGAVWLANPQLETVLEQLYVQGTTGGIFPVYLPANGLAGKPNATLKGIPIMYVEGMPAVGTTGDLVLVNPSTFYCVLKTNGARIETSVDAEFKNDIVLWKGAQRVVFGSKYTKAITRSDGTTAGNVITLATRA